MSRRKRHGGLKEILASGQMPGVVTSDSWAANRRTGGADSKEAFDGGFYHIGLGKQINSKAELEAEFAKGESIPLEGGYSL